MGRAHVLTSTTAIDSFQLAEEAIALPVLPSCSTVLGLLVILVYVLELLLTLLRASLVPKISQLSAGSRS
jgi:hypothetical protein